MNFHRLDAKGAEREVFPIAAERAAMGKVVCTLWKYLGYGYQ